MLKQYMKENSETFCCSRRGKNGKYSIKTGRFFEKACQCKLYIHQSQFLTGD
jgi:hypothetical protein